ncbi:hypothetical protein MMC28_004373 [Mycoblastus sanguinarius]|nr:hypothetical protein [Mycoblastus sanguinarius]
MALTEHLPQNPLGLAVVLLAITTTYLTALVIYRIYLSPLARIPGPKLAGATGWYEFYYDCLQAGRYIFEIERMHRVYGPIVRISPQEVHINDPEYFAELQSNTSKLDKYAWFYNFVAAPDAGFGTASHDLHRPRRGAMAKYFSMSNVIRLEPLIKKCVTKLCSRIEEHRKGATKVDLSNAYRCLATDVITEYALPGSRLMLESPDFAASYNRVLKDFSHIATWHRHIPIILPLLLAVPRWITARMNQASLAVAENQDFFKASATKVVFSKGLSKATSHPTVLHEIYNSDLPPSDKSVSRLTQEAQTLVGAGTETTGNTLSVTTFHLLSNPSTMKKLKQELLEMGGNLSQLASYQDLQKLSYLAAVISEGLRLSSSVVGRLPRINPKAAMQYKSFIIPAGTAVSVSIRDVHFNESIFPDAHQFKPERWLGDLGRKRALEKYLVPFSKGSRSCVGMELALAELYLVIGNMFRTFDMNLVDTTMEDMRIAHDFFSPFAPSESKGLRILVI